MSKPEYYDLFAWFGKKKVKIGYAVYDEKAQAVRLKPEAHIDANKLGRAMLKGDILIGHRKGNPELAEAAGVYESAADEFD